jgi:hypothetical protein
MSLFIKQAASWPFGLIFKQLDDSSFALSAFRVAGPQDSQPVDGGTIDPSLAEQELVLSTSVTVSLLTLSNRGDWGDYACFGVALDFPKLLLKPAFNLFAVTAASKVQAGDLAKQVQESYAALVYVPRKTTTLLSDCTIVLTTQLSPVITSTLPIVTTMPATAPALTLTGPATIAAGGYATYQLACPGDDFEVYLENTGGYLPLSRAQITGGVGSFQVGALGLTSGQSFRIKAGTKLYTGIADLTVTVQ